MADRKAKAVAAVGYVVANPRGIPKGRYIIRTAERVWFEGDAYDGPVTERWLRDGFIVPAGEVGGHE